MLQDIKSRRSFIERGTISVERVYDEMQEPKRRRLMEIFITRQIYVYVSIRGTIMQYDHEKNDKF